MHDPLSSYDLVHDELDQRRETGYAVEQHAAAFSALEPDDVEGLEALYLELVSAPRAAGWAYEEPEGLDAIVESLPLDTPVASPSGSELDDRVLGGWLGRIAGCNLGKPVEWGEHWTTSHLRDYLERADAWPLRDYIPVLEPMPAEFELRENWPETTRGRVDGSARDDDIDYAILGLHLLEQHGAGLLPDHVADAWLTLLPYLQVYTAERASYLNLLHNVPVAEVATTRNPYREWIGALIRGDAFGWTNPADPSRAISLAYQDAALSHVANGVYGELWSAALVSSAFGAATVREAFERSLLYVPPRSRLAEALHAVLALRDREVSWDDAIAEIQRSWGHYSWVHTINNAAIIAAGLLWGEDDYSAIVGLTVQGGWDTDSNGATAGSVAGVVLGARALPRHFVEPLHDRTRSALFGFDNSVISDLARRTVALTGVAAR
ncbi:ADP-ribosylglycohydrolase family protein [Microbacterium ulmi]|uniref:ADP-ribosylglycohydrolase family protein n=1 Tax=Microbacterium ulmi TaxID=179095 RepID=A0A7Y2LZG3_9MICO|nr:ADP-ribosylglycohydrolase family protein [Microbacterium ulmi]NII69165.1 ADP-ribosylglycohydrolase [Microbacterium ulmi]NNH03705.1 ADP-ribosylglycohydrolase family protein [Microbacterium ulmi]